MIEDGVRIKLCHSFLDVFQAKLQPLIKGDDTGVLQVHGVKHLPQSLIILLHWAHGNEAGDKLQEVLLTLVEGLLTEDKFLNVGSFYFGGSYFSGSYFSGSCFSCSHLDN